MDWEIDMDLDLDLDLELDMCLNSYHFFGYGDILCRYRFRSGDRFRYGKHMYINICLGLDMDIGMVLDRHMDFYMDIGLG